MCRQDFVHCSCGHTALYDYPCELTNSHPLYLRFACENYEIIRKDEKRGCGSGKFYCRENQEGLFFEHVHDMLEEAQVDMSRLKTVYASVEALGAEFTRQNNLRGVSPEKRICHPTYTAISNRFQQVTFQKAETEAKGKLAEAVLKEGLRHYSARAALIRKGFRNESSPLTLPTSVLYKLPEDLQARFSELPGSVVVSNTTATAKAIDISDYRKPRGDLPYSLRPQDADAWRTPQPLGILPQGSRVASDLTQPSTEDFDPGPMSFLQTDRQVKRSIAHDLTDQAQESLTKKSQTTRKASLTDESSFVRRSARVRDKKVNYAESEASTVHSRETSPYKSERDNVSPPKSERSPSPSPRQKVLRHRPKMDDLRTKQSTIPDMNRNMSRINSSLSGVIDEWRRGSTRAFASPMQPTAYESNIYNDFSPIPGTHYNPTQSVTQPSSLMVSTQTPQTNVPWSNTNYQHMFANSNLMPSTPGLVPVSSYRHGLSANDAVRKYSATSLLQGHMFRTPPNHTMFPPQRFTNSGDSQSQRIQREKISTPSPVNLNYGQLQRSFSTTRELTPPMDVDAESIDTDPKKRSLSAPSPLPSSKRMRLSLPGDNAPSIYEQQLPYTSASSMSSPVRTTSRILSTNKENNAPMTAEEAVPSAPAPILAPTALMYVSHQQPVSSHVGLKTATMDGPQDSSGNEYVADDVDNPSSDIDWGVLSDEFF